MRVLGLDTSTALLSAAVLDGGALAAERTRESLRSRDRRPGRSNHAEGLLPLVAEVLDAAGTEFSSLSLVGVAVGPGTFTGLRIGISTAKGLVYGSDIPVVGVRTLEASAYRVAPAEEPVFVCPMVDARKGEVYASLFRRTAAACECLMEDSLAAPEEMVRCVESAAAGSCLYLGSGAMTYAEVIMRCAGAGRASVSDGSEFPAVAGAVARIAEARFRAAPETAAASLAPHYIRPPDALPSAVRGGAK
ncbi:MAG: tRNA (adenosine(37)-N6)-threonylcarbamoyltransferase complex dimerization subunit type 1 TsaB [Deltaproteobacteria bacterium]|nr:tRNA (adenosine(37)-N6)-threonylcarbamoyltransferase complex dimerization subunit type 1 TsaB [Deltaproteobacteria bacterium]